MDFGETVALIGVCLVAIGQLRMWQKNGRELREYRDKEITELATWRTEMGKDLQHINEELSSEDHGLVNLSKGQASFKTHCAEVSTTLAIRVERAESDIKDINKDLRER